MTADKPVPFIIVADLRTGSTLLSTTLDRHPEVRCLGELFHSQELPDNCITGVDRLQCNGRELIERAFSAPGKTCAGFKAMVFLPAEDRPQWRDAWQALSGYRGLHAIVLRRRDILAQYASFRVAQRTGVFYPSGGSRAVADRPTIRVDPAAFAFWRNERSRLYRERISRLAGRPILEIAYEQLALDWEKTIAEVQNFLQVPPLALQPAKQKQERRPLSEVIENFDELTTGLD